MQLTADLRSGRVGGLRPNLLQGSMAWQANLIVLPLSAFPHKVTFTPVSLAIGLTVHVLCVGLPIALAVRRYSR